MATSPIYSWPEPDNTDLVKNGALAMRTLGNAIDTTMATMVPKSTFTAKGSIAAATAASTPANVAVGSDGQILTADSTAATGVKWATPTSSSPLTTKGDLYTYSTTNARLGVGANDLLLTADSTQATGLTYTGGWTTWTPTLTNMTLGNGTITARYQKIGKIVNGYFQFVLGSTSAISSYPNFSLPITPSQGFMTFPAWYKDEGVNDYFGTVATLTSGNLWPRVGYAAGTYVSDYAISATVPFTWGTSDRFFCEFSYEVA